MKQNIVENIYSSEINIITNHFYVQTVFRTIIVIIRTKLKAKQRQSEAKQQLRNIGQRWPFQNFLRFHQQKKSESRESDIFTRRPKKHPRKRRGRRARHKYKGQAGMYSRSEALMNIFRVLSLAPSSSAR